MTKKTTLNSWFINKTNTGNRHLILINLASKPQEIQLKIKKTQKINFISTFCLCLTKSISWAVDLKIWTIKHWTNLAPCNVQEWKYRSLILPCALITYFVTHILLNSHKINLYIIDIYVYCMHMLFICNQYTIFITQFRNNYIIVDDLIHTFW